MAQVDIVDLRSDTVTKPSLGMLNFIMQSCKGYLGDDVFGEDQTVNQLEDKISKIFGVEDALYCPSGTMSNQIAIKLHTEPGDEVICDQNSHVYQYEVGGIAVHSHCSVKPLDGLYGILNAQQIENAIQPIDIHRTVSSLVVLENTHNRGGGSVYKLNDIKKIETVCKKNKLRLHLDGARIFNALVAQNENPKTLAKYFDSISVCFSKGLGAPVGSALLGSKKFIEKGRKIRKQFGGGMRQAGIIAAGALYAIEHNIERLKTDHQNASIIAKELNTKPFITNIYPVETNIIIFEIDEKHASAAEFTKFLKTKRILAFPISKNKVRFVFHLDITKEHIQYLKDFIKNL
ncbi:MAG: GntG family PLP-dependent aldolase [Alphaproteobacteria bacterium]|nr:GntG family PLP-dependent aldolase [Alphaproteobacteria bacterium]